MIQFPAGTSVYSGPMSLSGDGLVLRGEGSARSRVILPSGFDITYQSPNGAPRVEGVTLVTQGLAAGTALKITGPVAPSVESRGPIVSDVAITGDDPATQWWTKGLHLVDCWHSSIDGFSAKGRDDATAPFDMLSGTELERCMAITMRDFKIWHVQDAVLQSGSSCGEGVNLSDFEIIGVNRGIVLSNAALTPGVSIHDGHINAYARGLDLNHRAQLSIHDLLIYKTHVSASDFIGIATLYCDQLNIHDNIFNGSPTASGYTIGMQHIMLTDSSIAANKFKYFQGGLHGIQIGTGSARNIIAHNQGSGAIGNLVRIESDAGPGNKVEQNWSF